MGELWKRFLAEVLLESRAREKWRTPTDNLKVGDLVLVLEPGLLDRKWELRVINEAQPGTDGLVRSATVRTERGILTRATTHLVPLPQGSVELPDDAN